MKRDMKQLIDQMTIEEKASLCSGGTFWTTTGIERLGIPSIMLTDGPHGLRKQDGESDHLGLNESVPATCFPSASGLASSWNRDLIEQVGSAIGKEAQAEKVSVLLGPGVNIKRSPLCGRNFEYFSEDPYLTGELASSHIHGVQNQGVGTSLKHFAVNNQEDRRMSVNAVVDERTLREIYLTGFEKAVKQAKPWTLMSAYNKINGTYASENSYLLNDILREEWGHEGFVMSDWGAVSEIVPSIAAGMELEMPPSNGEAQRKIIHAVEEGTLDEALLDQAVERLLTIIFKCADHMQQDATYDAEAHHAFARQVAQETMVLLKNEDEVLPLQKTGHIAVIGELAQSARYQGGGSSHINPTKVDIPYEQLLLSAGDQAQLTYAQGYELSSDETNASMLQAALETAAAADVAILFVGLPDRYESEGYDRKHLDLPNNHQELIAAITTVQPNVIVVLSNGAPVVMPWLHNTKAVLQAYLGGQATGGAIADLLFGDANPSGKLAETFPRSLKHNPSALFFPGDTNQVEYREGIFVGYRYYEAKDIEPLFPFGYGLSYTQFEYSNLTVDTREIKDTEHINVSVQIKNTGSVPGKEIVQLYIHDTSSRVTRPEKELKGFTKIDLKPGEEKQVTITLDKRSFAYYDVERSDWHVDSGEFEILVGASSQDIRLTTKVVVNSTSQELCPTYHRDTTFGELLANPKTKAILAQMQPQAEQDQDQIQSSAVSAEMVQASMQYLPLRNLIPFTGMTEETLSQLLVALNQAAQSES